MYKYTVLITDVLPLCARAFELYPIQYMNNASNGYKLIYILMQMTSVLIQRESFCLLFLPVWYRGAVFFPMQ
jgi:hypothetical protein